jgi:hypothetical protein
MPQPSRSYPELAAALKRRNLRKVDLQLGITYGWKFERSLGCGIIVHIFEGQWSRLDYENGRWHSSWEQWRDRVYK